MQQNCKRNSTIIYDAFEVIIFIHYFSHRISSLHLHSLTALQTASKSLMEAVGDVYETQWTGADALAAHVQSLDSLWQDFSHKLGDQVLIPLNTYTAQFPEMKVRY